MLNEVLLVSLLTLVAGGAMAVGGLIAMYERIQSNWLEEEFRHSVIAFGGGTLLSAVALVLVPEGSKVLSVTATAILFAAGGFVFMVLDILLVSMKSPAAQLAAMLADFIPEAMALGAAFATGASTGPLLAVLIALQNVPEGFNSYREMTASGKFTGRVVVIAFAVMAVFGPMAGLTGYFVLASYPAVVGGIMIFAAGGILYVIFQDIAPQVKLEKHWLPPFSAVIGFLFGLVGQMVTTG